LKKIFEVYFHKLDEFILNRKLGQIYTTINFTSYSVTEVGALYGRLICGWLGVVWAWSTQPACCQPQAQCRLA